MEAPVAFDAPARDAAALHELFELAAVAAEVCRQIVERKEFVRQTCEPGIAVKLGLGRCSRDNFALGRRQGERETRRITGRLCRRLPAPASRRLCRPAGAYRRLCRLPGTCVPG